MTKIRMNTELRNKLFNKMKNVFENEDTQERENFLSARESVDYHYDIAHKLAKQVYSISASLVIQMVTKARLRSKHSPSLNKPKGSK